MICIILAAGYATRMYPLTLNFPKPLLGIGGKSILTHLVENIDECDEIREFVVVTNHKFASMFHEWARDISYSTNAAISVTDDRSMENEKRLGAVRDIALGMRNVKNEAVMVIAGDNMVDFSLGTLMDYYKECKTSCVMRYREESEERLHKCGVIEIDGDLIVGMEEKPEQPKSNWVVPPFYIYTPEDAAKINEALDDGCSADAPGSFIQWLYKHSPVHAMEMTGKRYDVGSIDGYEKLRDGWDE